MKHIVIIEDEQDIALLERDYLDMAGYSVTLCHTGEEGLKQVLENECNLVLLDIMLPGLDGYEVCRRIRAGKNIPIILISAKREDIDKIRGLGLGADDYMTKPFSPSELVARVKAHLSRYERLTAAGSGNGSGSAGGENDEIRIRGLTVDRSSRRVFVGSKEVPFTAREFDLLVFLARHPNRVFSKEDLFEHIWGMDSSGELPTVTVHIRRLREKIEADPSNPQYIETVWGAGYRFTV